MLSKTLLLSFTVVTLISAQTVAEQQQNDQIPAWYQMAKPAAGGAQQQQGGRGGVAGVPAQASPSYYERIEAPTYETRREQAGYERPGIQTNQFANYPSYQNRQPYDNLNALTNGASLSNLQQASAGRRYPSSVPIQAGGNDNQSAVKRYHKLLLKRREWTTKIPRILAKSTTWAPSTTTTEEPTTTTTQKMPKSLKSIYQTILPKKKEEATTTTEGPTTTRKVVRASTRPPMARTFKPYGTRKGWRMWKKATTPAPTTTSTTTTEEPSTTTEEEPTTTEELITTTTEEITTLATTEEAETTTEEEVSTTTEVTTTEETTTITTEELEVTTPEEVSTSTQEEESTSTSTSTEEPSTTTTTQGPLRYICRHRAGPNESGPFAERHAQTTQGPFRPIVVGTHSWKPLRFKKPQNLTTSSSSAELTSAPKGLKLLEYLLTRTDAFARGLKRAFNGPNTELLAAIKDVVAKFKASLDEAGIDQDVRQMGNQLKNTWQQLRTGLDRGMNAVRKSAESSMSHFQFGAERQPPVQPVPLPVQIPYQQHYQYPVTASSNAYTPGPMNEQLGKLFEKAVADAADLKQQKSQNNL